MNRANEERIRKRAAAGDELLPINDVARMFGVYRQTVRLWVVKGQMPAEKTLGGNIRIWRSDAEQRLGQRVS